MLADSFISLSRDDAFLHFANASGVPARSRATYLEICPFEGAGVPADGDRCGILRAAKANSHEDHEMVLYRIEIGLLTGRRAARERG
jgi:hypothetical protein